MLLFENELKGDSLLAHILLFMLVLDVKSFWG
jgi:hypothetical protein